MPYCNCGPVLCDCLARFPCLASRPQHAWACGPDATTRRRDLCEKECAVALAPCRPPQRSPACGPDATLPPLAGSWQGALQSFASFIAHTLLPPSILKNRRDDLVDLRGAGHRSPKKIGRVNRVKGGGGCIVCVVVPSAASTALRTGREERPLLRPARLRTPDDNEGTDVWPPGESKQPPILEPTIWSWWGVRFQTRHTRSSNQRSNKATTPSLAVGVEAKRRKSGPVGKSAGRAGGWFRALVVAPGNLPPPATACLPGRTDCGFPAFFDAFSDTRPWIDLRSLAPAAVRCREPREATACAATSCALSPASDQGWIRTPTRAAAPLTNDVACQVYGIYAIDRLFDPFGKPQTHRLPPFSLTSSPSSLTTQLHRWRPAGAPPRRRRPLPRGE